LKKRTKKLLFTQVRGRDTPQSVMAAKAAIHALPQATSAPAPETPAVPKTKSFFASFFSKKEVLACFPSNQRTAAP
jgi:hypothetical protein